MKKMKKATIYDFMKICKDHVCYECPLSKLNKNGDLSSCIRFMSSNDNNVDIINDLILNWQTRQDKFLKLFPDADLDDDGTIIISPCSIDNKLYKGNDIPCYKHHKVVDCNECRKEYWLNPDETEI